MRLVGWFGLGAGVVWVLLSPAAIKILYGSDFMPAVPALQWLGVAFVVVFIHGHYRFGLISANRQRNEMITSALGTLTSLSLIPVGYVTFGVTGAALALVAGEVTILVSSWLFSRWQLNLGGELLCLIRPLICIASLYVLLRILPVNVPLAVQVTISIVWIGIAAYLGDAEVKRLTKQVFSP
jgi:O-antigen/teichoic acid export membrane protein